MAKILIAVQRLYWGKTVASLLTNKGHSIFYSHDKRSILNIVQEINFNGALIDFNIAKCSLEEVLTKNNNLIVAVLGNLPGNGARKALYQKEVKKLERPNVRYFERVGFYADSIATYLSQ